jgi:hypothetical protein
VAWATAARRAAAAPIYSNDFQGAAGSEWSSTTTEVPPANPNRRFLGRFADGTVSLSLSGIPTHNLLRLDFDLYVIASWDGDGSAPDSPDIWSVELEGRPALVRTTFSNFPGRTQDYPGTFDDVPGAPANPPKTGAVEVNTLGYPGFLDFPGGDAVYHFSLEIPHSESSATFNFTGGPGLTSVDDESWGLDNVAVSAVVPEPATGACIVIGMLACAVRRRRNFLPSR